MAASSNSRKRTTLNSICFWFLSADVQSKRRFWKVARYLKIHFANVLFSANSSQSRVKSQLRFSNCISFVKIRFRKQKTKMLLSNLARKLNSYSFSVMKWFWSWPKSWLDAQGNDEINEAFERYHNFINVAKKTDFERGWLTFMANAELKSWNKIFVMQCT